MYSSLVLCMISKFYWVFLFFKQPFEKWMIILITEFMKCKLVKITIFLCNVNVTFLMSWTLIFITQEIMTSNFINNCFSFTKSKMFVISEMFFIFVNLYNIFINVFEIDCLLVFYFSNLIHEPIYNITSQRRLNRTAM